MHPCQLLVLPHHSVASLAVDTVSFNIRRRGDIRVPLLSALAVFALVIFRFGGEVQQGEVILPTSLVFLFCLASPFDDVYCSAYTSTSTGYTTLSSVASSAIFS
jgi:hypothetical protein